MRQPKSDGGFTIIEVLIVLAIAGLITLLVFLAIPALLRNQRNDQRKTSVSNILSAIHTFELNNSGQMAPNCGSSDASCNALNQGYHNEDFGYYNDTNGTQVIICQGNYGGSGLVYGDAGNQTDCYARNPPTVPPSTSMSPVHDVNKVYVYNYQRCDPNTQGAGTSSAAGYSDQVAMFALESGTGDTPQCIDL